LTALSLLPLTSDVLQQREKAAKEHRWEDPALALALQFQQADRIVIGAPYWDLSFPSVLKVYLEHIMVNHVVFRFTENGATGLCKADKLVYIMTAGGFVGGRNFGYDYIRALSRMVGITEVEQYCAEGLDLDGVDTYPILQDVMGKMEV
ncbi:MAG: NAD(P)H-dependent oxidoreductase, partial [Oscillospiraceae bacterium]|nr:NAD(P)H-dependent oxidoreductase [Oscillospiraceae bacterium]